MYIYIYIKFILIYSVWRTYHYKDNYCYVEKPRQCFYYLGLQSANTRSKVWRKHVQIGHMRVNDYCGSTRVCDYSTVLEKAHNIKNK